MSQHPSLRSSAKDKQHRSVLKRHERIKLLKDKEKWEEKDSVFGLPKVKVMRFKIKKEKAAVAEDAEGTAVAPVPGAAAAPTSKTAAPSKAAASQAKTASPAKGASPKEGARPGGEAKK